MLDANDEQKIGKGLPEEYKANLRKNVADAIGILAKLTTGIDVNVRFHDVKGFEFTDEIAIFDLLDISLVHGWLIDPQVCSHLSSHMISCMSLCTVHTERQRQSIDTGMYQTVCPTIHTTSEVSQNPSSPSWRC